MIENSKTLSQNKQFLPLRCSFQRLGRNFGKLPNSAFILLGYISYKCLLPFYSSTLCKLCLDGWFLILMQ